MGGEVWIESEEGVGSSFHFTLPAQAASATDRLEPIVEEPSLAGKRLLIVDDNQTSRLIVRKYAEKWGMKVIEAESGPDALACVAQGAGFDLAILDFQMPEMDGFSLAKKLHSELSIEKIPLILLSSLGSYRGNQEIINQFSAFVSKPVKPSQLLEVVTTVLSKESSGAIKRTFTAEVGFDPGLGKKFPLNILLVDDNLLNQKVATKLLEKYGYSVDIASNGIEAIQALERQKYDVTFMDIQMPEMDGEEATRIIHQTWLPVDRPWIIAMTAHSLEGDREHFISIGMDDYISKPLDFKELFRVLERIPKPQA